ncbi:MAG: UDP-N-acetylmuramoyl-L-alanine--D-glutamate ligase [bacterium]|nr:UDP-N-acetylmuramoyl-L-alanine--D-glutamate ligase [bacterium]
MNIAILGFAREGRSLLKFLKKAPKFKGAKITILDKKLNKNYLHRLDRFDLLFRSPGIPYNLPEIQQAIKGGLKISSATKLFFDLCPAKVIGVTGTKGKGTTSTLIYKILKEADKDVYLAGNIGKPALNILPELSKKSLVILELSSFQLQDLKKSPTIAIVLDIFPDHLDSHKNMREYLAAKTNICAHQTKKDVVFYFKNNPLSQKMALHSRGRHIPISAPDNLSKNKIMAATVAAHLNCSRATIDRVIKNFHGMKHRLELIRNIKISRTTKQHSGILNNMRVLFYDDSASTNPQTAAVAVLSFAPNKLTNSPTNQLTILIAGGKDKNLNYTPLAKAIKKSGNVKLVILFGENKIKIKKTLETGDQKPNIKLAKNLKSAVDLAYQSARKLSNQPTNQLINIILSSGAASFDMFKDYADRGQQFKKIVKKIAR